MTIEAHPLTAFCGAEITGLDLSRPLAPRDFNALKQALFEWGVVFLRDQKLSRNAQAALARRFGETEIHPIVKGMEQHPEIIKMHKPAGENASFGVGWHSDNSFMQQPSMATIVYAEKVPPQGGDTLFAHQGAAYNQLSAAMQNLLKTLRARHSAQPAYTAPSALEKYQDNSANTPMAYKNSPILSQSVDHPAIIRHPETGQPALYLNPMFTLSFTGMTQEESQPLLSFLFAHACREEFQCRFRWRKDSLAIWDNRLVQHAALNDYPDFERILYRATVKGQTPQSPSQNIGGEGGIRTHDAQQSA